MPPFGKATRNEDNEVLTALEKDGQDRIARALDKLRRDIFRGITENNAHIMTRRLDDSEVTKPFADTIENLVTEWALAGVDSGRQAIERLIADAR